MQTEPVVPETSPLLMTLASRKMADASAIQDVDALGCNPSSMHARTAAF